MKRKSTDPSRRQAWLVLGLALLLAIPVVIAKYLPKK